MLIGHSYLFLYEVFKFIHTFFYGGFLLKIDL